MRPVRGVTVDLDDTLFPQAQWLAGAWEAVADRAECLGLDGPGLRSTLLRVAGEGSDRGGIIDRALFDLGVPPGRYVDDLVSAFTAHAPGRLVAYPDALAALARLRGLVPVVLLTDGNPRIQRAKIAALGLDGLLDAIVISDELGGRAARKPSPVPFRHALGLLGLPAEEVVHIGDRPGKDVVGARRVGMRCVRVRTGEYATVADDRSARPWLEAGSFSGAVDLLVVSSMGTASALSRL